MKRNPFDEIVEELEGIKNGILRDIVNSYHPSVDRFMHQEKLIVINMALESVEHHAPSRVVKTKRKKV